MSDKNNQEQAEDAQTLEVFLVKDDPLSIPKLTIIDEDKVEITFYTGSDMCPYWLRIAYDHLLLTEKASAALAEAKERGDNEAMGDALKAGLSSGMQAMMASAIAIDAFYASVKEYVAISAETTQAWRKNKTSRYTQISEVLRLAFRLDNTDTQFQRKIIKEIFDFRDKVVHPPSGTYPPVLHPQLNKATSWWYPAFRFRNAKTIAASTLSIITRLAGSPKKEDYLNLDLAKYCRALVVKIKPLIDAWEEQYGVLFEDTA